jgi:hypothetical protein
VSFKLNDMDLLLGPAENQLDDYAEGRLADWTFWFLAGATWIQHMSWNYGERLNILKRMVRCTGNEQFWLIL